MKKKSIIVLLSVILVLVSASTGVCFAESFSAFPPVGSIISEVPAQKQFFCWYADATGYTSSNPLYIFNDLGVYENSYGFSFIHNGVSTSIFGEGNYLYFGFNVNGELVFSTSSTYTEGRFNLNIGSSLTNPQFGGSSITASDLSITLGDSYELGSASTIDTYHFSLPYGNVLLISSESDFTINRRAYSISNTTYNYQKYVRASDNFSYRVNGSYQGVVENSNIVGTFGLSVFGSNDVMSLLIPWQPVNQNVLGRATSYNYYNASPDPTAEVSVLSGQSFMIWYPYYANNQDTSKINETNMEVSIDIYHSAPITFTTFPITGSTASSGEDAYIQNTASTSSGGSSSQSDAGDGSINVTFDNAPTAGGNHGQAPINDNNSILGVLSNLQNTLLGLFNKAIDGIHNLITLGSDFLQSVQIMFSWLPAELLVIITSGFVILLTIGVLKTLWR